MESKRPVFNVSNLVKRYELFVFETFLDEIVLENKTITTKHIYLIKLRCKKFINNLVVYIKIVR